MKLEDQVAPLALAQRMKELGFPQGTEFGWTATDDTEAPRVWHGEKLEEYGFVPQCAAPTVAEMGEWLPAYIEGYSIQPSTEGDAGPVWIRLRAHGGGGTSQARCVAR